MKLIRDEEFSYLTKIILLPGLGFKNLLPVPIQIYFTNQREERLFNINKHEQIHFSDFDVSVKVGFKIKIPGYLQSEEFTLVEN